MTGDIHMLLGSYVLGGLSAEDRRTFDEHLEGCPRCRAELAEAAPLPALLRKVPGVPGMTEVSVAAPPSDPSLISLLATARTRRRRQFATRWVATAAAAAIAFGGGAAAVDLTRHHDDDGSGRTVAMRSAEGDVTTGVVGLTQKSWGTAIWIRLGDMPHAGVFTLWATDDQGHTELAATWGATADGVCDLNGATSIPTAHLRSVSVLGPGNSVVAVAPVRSTGV